MPTCFSARNNGTATFCASYCRHTLIASYDLNSGDGIFARIGVWTRTERRSESRMMASVIRAETQHLDGIRGVGSERGSRRVRRRDSVGI
jgi:hypothetical protein